MIDDDAPPPPRLKFTWARELGKAPPRGRLVKGLLDQGAIALLYGESGAGKSTLALHLAICLATGEPFFGQATTPGTVLYLAGEGGDGLMNRIEAARAADQMTADAPLAIVKKAVILDPEHEDFLALMYTAATVASEAGQPLRAIFVDTLARSLVGDENTATDMGRFIRACDWVRNATGAAIIIVHHAGKDTTKGARGHSSLRAAVDTEILVEGRTNPRTVTIAKQRDLPIREPFAFELSSLTIGEDEDGDPITACVPTSTNAPARPSRALGKQQARLLAELERRAGGSEFMVWTESELREIARDLDMHKSSARDAVVGLRALKYLTDTVGGARLTHVVEPGRTGRNGTKRPNSSRTFGDEKDEGSIDPVLSSRPSSRSPADSSSAMSGAGGR